MLFSLCCTRLRCLFFPPYPAACILSTSDSPITTHHQSPRPPLDGVRLPPRHSRSRTPHTTRSHTLRTHNTRILNTHILNTRTHNTRIHAHPSAHTKSLNRIKEKYAHSPATRPYAHFYRPDPYNPNNPNPRTRHAPNPNNPRTLTGRQGRKKQGR